MMMLKKRHWLVVDSSFKFLVRKKCVGSLLFGVGVCVLGKYVFSQEMESVEIDYIQ